MGLGCLNDRIVGLSQHLLDEKIKNTTFTLPLNTVPKGSLDDLGKGDRLDLAWASTSGSNVLKSPQAQQGF